MPLTAPDERELIHKRRIECNGYRRNDGLWDIEGHITDTKDYDFESSWRGSMPAGTPIHEMWIRLTIDDNYLIHKAEACTDYSPYPICPQAASSMKKMEGVRMMSGWRREINKQLGGTLGCTHLRELLGPIATTAFQTIAPIRSRDENTSTTKVPGLINTCYAYSADKEVVKKLWPDHAE